MKRISLLCGSCCSKTVVSMQLSVQYVHVTQIHPTHLLAKEKNIILVKSRHLLLCLEEGKGGRGRANLNQDLRSNSRSCFITINVLIV